MAKTDDINMEMLYFVRLSNIDNLYNYFSRRCRPQKNAVKISPQKNIFFWVCESPSYQRRGSSMLNI